MNRIKRSPNSDLLALSHPLTLLSVIILLINDHVLKVYAPSAVTGKISDFAGLFFFPLLLGAILNSITKPLKLKPHSLAAASFGFTAVWFSLIKILPFFTAFTETFLSNLLSIPVRIIPDPSDLIALVALVPAWKLRVEVETRKPRLNKPLTYIALALASIAVLATSPQYNPTVRKMIVEGNRLFTPADTANGYYYSSADGGRTWEWVEFEVPASVASQADEYPQLPVKICLPDEPNHCYQSGTELILESNDGGNTWVKSWSIPAGRRQYIERSMPFLDLGPYDLIVFEYEGRQEIIAALGSGGVLVKADGGPWENFGVGGAGPLIFESNDLSAAMGEMLNEIIILSIVAVALLLFLVAENVADSGLGVYSLLKKVMIAFILSFVLAYLFLYNGSVSLIFVALFLFISAATVLLLLLQVIVNTTQKGQTGILVLLIDWFASCLAFVLWAKGTIPHYGTSLIIAIVLNVLTAIWLFTRQFTNPPPAP